MRRAIILILFLIFILAGCPGYLADPSVNVWLKAVSYHLFHANIFHLAANLLSVWFIFRVMPYRNEAANAKDLAFGFIIATLAYFVATRPVVGISNIIYAVIGLRTPSLSHRWWRQQTTIAFLVLTVAMLLVPRLSALTHIVSFIAGTLVAMGRRKIKSLDNDYRRAAHR